MDAKKLRGIAHHLDPVVTIGGGGLTDNVLHELDRALTDHELIKVRVAVADRSQRHELGAQAAMQTRSELVQEIGKIIVLYRANPEAKPNLSNIQRYSA